MKFKFILFMLIIFTTISVSHNVKAEELKSFDVVSSEYGDYTYKVAHVFSKGDTKSEPLIGYKLSDYLISALIMDGEMPLLGRTKWDNPDYIIKEGAQEVKVNFISDNETVQPSFSYTVYLYGIKRVWENADGSSEPTREEDIIESNLIINPTLTAESLLINKDSTFDINVNDKISGTYTWKSSNNKILKVNSKNGIVTALSDGTVKVTCIIKGKNGELYNLETNVTVGIDDNYPTLTTDYIDLSIGDKYDLDVENGIAKAKYKYIISDRNIATVNSSNGIITAKKDGITNIYCIIATPDKQTIVLKSVLTVTK